MYDFNVLAPKIRRIRSAARQCDTVHDIALRESRRADNRSWIFIDEARRPIDPRTSSFLAGAVLPGSPVETSDSLLDELMRIMDVDTLPLPTRKPVSYAVWRQSGTDWLLEGLLVDSLETLNRTGAVQTSVGGSEIVTRCQITTARTEEGELTVHRTNENWTRVFLKPPAPIVLLKQKSDLTLSFTTSDGMRSGTRTIGARPAILEREGF